MDQHFFSQLTVREKGSEQSLDHLPYFFPANKSIMEGHRLKLVALTQRILEASRENSPIGTEHRFELFDSEMNRHLIERTRIVVSLSVWSEGNRDDALRMLKVWMARACCVIDGPWSMVEGHAYNPSDQQLKLLMLYNDAKLLAA